jgi:hypothetical protein
MVVATARGNFLGESFTPKALTTITAATKAANCVLTLAAGDAVRLVPNASVYITGSGFALLDNRWSKIQTAAGTSCTLVTNTTGEAGTFTAGTAKLAVHDTPTPQ